MIFLLLSSLGCVKKNSPETQFVWPTNRQFVYSVEYQQTGSFRPSGAADVSTNLNLIFTFSCQALPKEGRLQKMSCNIPANVIKLGEGTEAFDQTIHLEWKGNRLSKFDVEGLSDSMTSVFKSIFSGLDFGETPNVCEQNLTWTDKSVLKLTKLHGLSGSSAYKNEYQIQDCSNNMHVNVNSTFSLSAMSTENTSAPTFTFQSNDYVILDSNSKLVLSRKHSQVLSNSSTSLKNGSITQNISLKLK